MSVGAICFSSAGGGCWVVLVVSPFFLHGKRVFFPHRRIYAKKKASYAYFRNGATLSSQDCTPGRVPPRKSGLGPREYPPHPPSPAPRPSAAWSQLEGWHQRRQRKFWMQSLCPLGSLSRGRRGRVRSGPLRSDSCGFCLPQYRGTWRWGPRAVSAPTASYLRMGQVMGSQTS